MKTTSSRTNRISILLAAAGMVALASLAPVAHALPVITTVVETGGDNEATDTVPAKWTGVTFVGGIANEPVPGLAVGASYTVGFFNNHAPSYVDRNHRWTNASATVLLPPYLVGAEYIMSGNDNRDNAAYTLDITVATVVKAYLLIDNRLSDTSNANPPTFDATHMQWVLDDGWVPVKTGVNRTSDISLPDEVGIDEGADGTINNNNSIYTKTFPAGTFRIRQPDNAGQNMYGVAVVSIAPPSAPANLAAASADAKVTLNWTGGGGAVTHNVKRSLTAGGPYETIASVSATTYVDTTVVNGVTYYYVVSAVNAAGESAPSGEVTGRPMIAPAGVFATGGINQVTVGWDPLVGAASYTVKRSAVSGGPYVTVASGIAGTSYLDSGLLGGRHYYYVVSAQLVAGGDSGDSVEVSGLTAPGAPTLSTTLFAASVIRVGWSTDPVVTQINLEQSADGVTFVPLASAGAGQGYTNSSLTAATTYYYRATAENATGLSDYSAVVSRTTPASGFNINFGTATAPVPPGYQQDVGDTFADRGNGLSYGWDRSVVADGRIRGAANSPDLRYDTFVHLIKAIPPAVWEIEIPNGYYEVHIVAGDPANSDSVFQFDAEGVLTATVTPGGPGSFNFNWADFTVNTAVSDGRLTIRSGPNSQTTANNNKIAFIDIYPAVAIAPTIGAQPQNVAGEEYHTVSFSATVASGSAPFAYQWYHDGTPVPGGNGPVLQLLHPPPSAAGSYTLVVTNYGGSATSLPATLTLTPDTTAPVLLTVATLDGVALGLCFSEDMNNANGALTDYFTYAIAANGGVVDVIAATLRPDGRSVALRVSAPIVGPYTVTVTQETLDYAGNRVPAVPVSGVAGGYFAGDVGAPALAGSHFTCDGTTVEVVGGGADIWGASDQGYFVMRPTSGDFDARVKVSDLRGANAITKALLVAREDTSAGARAFHVSVNPPPPGRDQQELGLRSTTGGATASWGATIVPAGIPNTWMRLTRLANTFTGYRSSNGVDWIAMGTNVASFPAELLIGLAVTAHDNTLLATGTFSNFRLTSLVGPELVNESSGPGGFSADFPTYEGFSYTVQFKNDVDDTAWNALTTLPGTGGTQSFTDADVSPTGHRIYRVRFQ